jgi:CRISPR-associated protein Cmr6
MNLNHQFYRKYYENFDPREFAGKGDKKAVADRNTTDFRKRNALIYGFQPQRSEGNTLRPEWYRPGAKQLADKAVSATFSLETTYPGLILGTGYKHETNSLDEITIGFYFDYATGLPIIPGSSVKGILRSFFPCSSLLGDRAKPELQASKYAYLRKCLAHVGAPPPEGNGWIDKIEADIFAGQRDVFFEATLTKTNAEGKILGPDFITPHGNNPLRNPVPLRMVKVLPEVTFTFSFKLNKTVLKESEEEDAKTVYTLTADQKERLFRILLLVGGVGAKTNVGYGCLTDPLGTERELPYLEFEEKTPGATGNEGADDEGPDEPGDQQPEASGLPVFSPTADKWFQAGSLNPKRPPKVNAKVLRKLTDRSVEVQILISGLTDKMPIKCELKLFVDALPVPGHWVEVQIKSFAGKKASAKNFLLKDNYYELIGKS